MIDAFVGLGSNLGAPVANLRSAVLALEELPGTDVVFVSHVYESEPWGIADQPAYANAVAWIRTTLRADQLLGYLHDIEERLGRVREERWGPRAIDLDLLLFGDEEWDTDRLVLPHPRVAERDFVLTPLRAIAPHVTWPDGTPLAGREPLVGRIVADHGRLPDVDPDWYVWEARDATLDGPLACGEEAPWDPASAWVEVARAGAAGGEMTVLESKLRALGIPYELSHRELGDSIGSLAGPAAILVPAERAREARTILGTEPGVPPTIIPRDPGPAPERPAWFRATITVFGWIFAIYWIVRILNREGF